MKKILIIFVSVLAGLFIGLFLLGQRGDYTVEKKVWRLHQEYVDIAKDPAVIPDRTFDDVIAAYEKIISQYPDSNLTPGLYIRLGEIYALRKDYEKAREVLGKIVQLYPDNRELCADAIFKTGKTYELAENWVKASQIYTGIIKTYPETDTALGVPVYIAGYYRKQNDFQKTMEAYEIAIGYYNRTASEYAGEKAGLTALRLLSNCYLEQNRWQESINTLGRILEKYSTSGFLEANDVDMTIKTINIMSAYQLKDYNVAIALYQGIIDRNPELPLSSYLQKVIDAFNQLREKGVEPADLK